jgi:hypothetical protein
MSNLKVIQLHEWLSFVDKIKNICGKNSKLSQITSEKKLSQITGQKKFSQNVKLITSDIF